MQQTSHDLGRAVGRVLADRYELGPVLGQGGMAKVHRGLDRQLGRQVAIKVLAPPFDRDRSFVERFRREARAAAGLSHPNIVAVFDSGSDEGTHFIVTELVEGETLADRLRRDGRMPPPEAVAVAADVSRALGAAHERGLIHRDIKPGNVMLLPDGGVKVVDFGIARAAGSDTLTNTGVVLGSTAYLSPEQAGGQPVDERADLYALGCVLYEMLTGRVPFSADTPVATMYRHVNEDPPSPSSIAPVPPELEGVVMRCLEKDPRRRFASAVELEGALLAVPVARGGDTMRLETVGAAETQPIAVSRGRHRPPAPPRGHRPWLVAALVGALLFALIGVLVAATSDPLPPKAVVGDTAREATESPPPTEGPASFATAWSDLVSAIGSAQASDDLSDHAADELLKRANELLDAYRDGDAEKLGESLTHLEEELAKAVEDEEISPTAADAIDTAIFDLVVALEDESALEVVPTAAPTGPTGEDGDEQGNDHGGSPPYGEANGHEDD